MVPNIDGLVTRRVGAGTIRAMIVFPMNYEARVRMMGVPLEPTNEHLHIWGSV
jgi:hypothetical protein